MLQIPASESDWRQDLIQAYRSPYSLLQFLEISPDSKQLRENPQFPLLVTRHYAALMRKGNGSDPLFRQVWPDLQEDQVVAGFSADPVGESFASKAEGILQKYHGRILVMPTASCAIHCRHCFRRSYPYHELKTHGLSDRLRAFLQADPSIHEVILSGGDPLLLDDDALLPLLLAVQDAPAVQRLRIHTRLPIVLPSRFTQALLDLLANLSSSVVLVVHCNHAQELDDASLAVFRALQERGVLLLNQSVLLRGINDSVEALEALSLCLFQQGVLPYYLHQLDRVEGAAHFEVSEEVGKRLIQELATRLPGYLVPRYVREIPGESGKTPL